MMQKKIVDQKIKELEVQEFVELNLKGVGLSTTQLQITPMAEKIIINTSRPGLVVGRKGQSIKKMTALLKKKFNLDNPQIEINEVTEVNLDAAIIAERIVNTMERFGVNRFKGIGHKAMEDAMNAGALGIEILVSGKVPSSRARRWRFYQGYLKKCGDIAVTGVKIAYRVAHLKTGSVGVQVRLMPGDIRLPDNIKLRSEIETIVEEIPEGAAKQNDEKESAGKIHDKPKEEKEPEKKQRKQKGKETKKSAPKKPLTDKVKKQPKAKGK